MNFFRMIKMDFKRMFLSGKFYFAIAGAMLVTVLNISQEAMQSRWNVSVYYLVVSSHGVGAFFEVFSVLSVLPDFLHGFLLQWEFFPLRQPSASESV